MTSTFSRSLVAAVVTALTGLAFASAAAATTYDSNAYVPGYASQQLAQAIQGAGSTVGDESDVVDRAVARHWSWPDGYRAATSPSIQPQTQAYAPTAYVPGYASQQLAQAIQQQGGGGAGEAPDAFERAVLRHSLAGDAGRVALLRQDGMPDGYQPRAQPTSADTPSGGGVGSTGLWLAIGLASGLLILLGAVLTHGRHRERIAHP